MIKESALKFYGVGIVLYDKLPGTPEINVMPVEDLTQLQGKLREIIYDFDVKVPDHQGIKRIDKMQGGVTLTAKWINLGESNRTTAPDVYTHETVLLIKVSDNDQIYWTDMLNETSLRRLETVRYSYSNKSSGFDPYDGDSSYWIEWDTRNKRVQIHTSENDGEFTKYDIIIDTRAGTMTTTDGVGNSFVLDSRAGSFVAETTDSITHRTKNYRVECDDYVVQAKTATVEGSSSLDLKSGGSLNVAGGNVELSGSSVTCNGDDLKIDKT